MSGKRFFTNTVMVVLAAVLLAGCTAKVEKTDPNSESASDLPKDAKLLVELPDYCNTPDGMALTGDGGFVLSVPNYNDPSPGAFIMKVSADNEVSKFFETPPHPETGVAGPMGICLAPSGDFYYADNQFGPNTPGMSSVMRIEKQLAHDKPRKAVRFAYGLNVANAVVVKDDYLYVSDTVLVPGSKPLISGIFRFKLDEEGVELTKPIQDDPHLIATITSQNADIGFGADGLCFDSKGNLYCGNFADGTIHKITFDTDGNVASNTIWVDDPKMKCADGLFCDPATDRILMADMIQNAIQMIYPDGTVKTIAQNGDTDGSDGGLDQPCEAILRGNEVIVSNMDWPFEGVVNTTWDKPYTLSVVKLDD